MMWTSIALAALVVVVLVKLGVRRPQRTGQGGYIRYLHGPYEDDPVMEPCECGDCGRVFLVSPDTEENLYRDGASGALLPHCPACSLCADGIRRVLGE